jgi:hypothetical protein
MGPRDLPRNRQRSSFLAVALSSGPKKKTRSDSNKRGKAPNDPTAAERAEQKRREEGRNRGREGGGGSYHLGVGIGKML